MEILQRKKLLFIGGVERSGTTILGVSLGRELQATVLPESPWKLNLCKGNLADWRLDPDENFKFGIWGAREPVGPFAGILPAEGFGRIVDQLLCRNSVLPTHIYIDHTPDNIANAETLMEKLLPSGFIYIKRDPIQVLSSLMATDWGIPTLRAALDFYLKRQAATEVGLEFLRQKHPEKLVEVEYEVFCANPTKIFSIVREQFGIPRSGAAGGANIFLPDYTARQHLRVLQPPVAVSKPPSFSSFELRMIRFALSPSQNRGLETGFLDLARFELSEIIRALRKVLDSLSRFRRRHYRHICVYKFPEQERGNTKDAA